MSIDVASWRTSAKDVRTNRCRITIIVSIWGRRTARHSPNTANCLQQTAETDSLLYLLFNLARFLRAIRGKEKDARIRRVLSAWDANATYRPVISHARLQFGNFGF